MHWGKKKIDSEAEQNFDRGKRHIGQDFDWEKGKQGGIFVEEGHQSRPPY